VATADRFSAATFEGEQFSERARAAGWYWEPRGKLLGSDWIRRCRERGSPRWGNYSWLTPKILLESLNDVIARRFDDIVPIRRQRWMAWQRAAGLRPTDLTIRWPGDPKLVILGDPGEADQSQYAVVKPMLSTCAETDFMVVLSDVIYPAGDINDYVDGFFRPNAEYRQPIYAAPGNHDWYDGLTGFMFHFCGAEPLPPVSYRRSGLALGQRIAASMWREPSAPNRATLLRHRRPEWPVQPAPYFAIETESLVYVLLDTGITGSIDREQAEWLIDASLRLDKDKVLLTGKPIYVDGGYRPCPILWDDPGQERQDDPPYATVDDVVRDPDHRYVAVVGGDTHNYQCSEVRVKAGGGERAVWHIVSGGGGAFLSETHTIPDRGSFEAFPGCGPTPPGDEVVGFRCYPTRGDSLALFTRRFGRGLFVTLAAATCAAVIAAALLAWLAAIGRVDVPGAEADPSPVELAAVAVVTLVGIVLAIVLGWLVAVRFLRVLSALIGGDRERWHEKHYRGVTAVAMALVVAATAVALLDLVVDDGTWEWAWTAAIAVVVIVVGVPVAILYSYQSRHGAAGLVRSFLPRLAAAGAVLGSLVLASGVGLSAAVIGGLLLGIAILAPAVGLLRERRPRVAKWILRAIVLVVVAAVLVSLLREWWPGQVALTVLATLVIVLWLAFVTVSWRALLVLPRLRNCRLAPDVAVQRVKEVTGLAEPERPVAASVSRSDRSLCSMLLAPPGKKRLFNRIVSQAAEATGPPFFKHFLRVSVEGHELVVRCYGVSGWVQHETEPVLQDTVTIPIRAPAGSGPAQPSPRQ
jgi:hypothetical protein